MDRTHSRYSINVFEVNERMWQRPVQKLGEGREDLDTVKQDPHKQEGATEAVQLPIGETEAIYGTGTGI